MTITRGLASAVFVVALPVFLLTSGVRWVALSESFYIDEFTRHRVGQTTGLSSSELVEVARGFIAYFQMPPQRMENAVPLPSSRGPLFNDRELAHMADVQILMHRVFDVWRASIAVLGVSAVVLFLTGAATGARAVARAAAFGAALTVFVVGAAGAASLADFSQLFLQFHLISFSNDLWMLDPRRDRLIQIFPFGFFFDAALRIALMSVAFGAVILGISVVTLRRMR